MILVALVCMFVCLFVCGQHYSKSYEWIGMKFYGGVLGIWRLEKCKCRNENLVRQDGLSHNFELVELINELPMKCNVMYCNKCNACVILVFSTFGNNNIMTIENKAFPECMQWM